MPALSPDTLLVDLIDERPTRARILDRLGIDWGRRGDRSLAEACEAQGLDPETVARMLDVAVETVPTEGNPEWLSVSLPDLMDHIQSTHHDYLRRALPRLSKRLKRASRNPDAETSRWFERVRGAFQALKSDLMTDLRREEEYVFPALRTVAEGRVLPDGSTPSRETLRHMADQYDDTKTKLERLRSLTDGYQAPEGADRGLQDVMNRLHELEVDLRRHLHEELHILFPRAESLL
ncbi:hemerythrin domain-containing protein [Salinibacter ruber]|uniref:Regulator of cell morphogenesis and NO signaling n=1 Tax=Salinibacter ruber TaxID=146919 RepID=A0A9X2ULE7_9BACT|nr:hemerythrin domain-containing protein [Salinibacter ruber]MCS3611390.1 regulator of cell morphogenesis and NO signaling [Salinibacter ruber]MCS3615558.1 regulator of cell morphogenesis and NO signaling [Salinibacter ruber]MCS3674061.1 regulator of cell morphogenesis and NO signaling [Salinibacter ruber]MCS3785384.1 regulator of cell morphogenesis and NO signaling [Salinibacter ruber]MCS4036485.1 regulator of cell morphogenesis and NO signaling [Salinibacter ruber]